jgi:hypothetical protein
VKIMISVNRALVIHPAPLKKTPPQARIMENAWRITMLLQLTLANPWIPSIAARLISGAGLLLAGYRVYPDFKAHLQEVGNVLGFAERVQVAMFPLLLGAVQVGSLYAVQACLGLRKEVTISLALWSAYINVCFSITIHVLLVFKKFIDADKECNYELKEKLTTEIVELRFKIDKIVSFVKARPELYHMSLKYLKKYPDTFGCCPKIPRLECFSLETQLSMRKTELENTLAAGIKFIKSHEELYACFKRHAEESFNKTHSS